MLVLSRKLNERIVIDGGIVITIVKIEGGQVRVGIEAPEHIKICREEILDNSRRTKNPEASAVATVV
jgi:carbon storage regulator